MPAPREGVGECKKYCKESEVQNRDYSDCRRPKLDKNLMTKQKVYLKKEKKEINKKMMFFSSSLRIINF